MVGSEVNMSQERALAAKAANSVLGWLVLPALQVQGRGYPRILNTLQTASSFGLPPVQEGR